MAPASWRMRTKARLRTKTTTASKLTYTDEGVSGRTRPEAVN